VHKPLGPIYTLHTISIGLLLLKKTILIITIIFQANLQAFNFMDKAKKRYYV